MLYPQNSSASLDPKVFRAPGPEYRGAPFWSWNCSLDRDQLLRQLEHFRDMGMGGMHIHSRTGLATEYLGDEFMGHVRACLRRGRQLGLLTWLYDEDRWPSGYGGGRVTEDPRFRARKLLFTPTPRASNDSPAGPDSATPATADRPADTANLQLLARYEVILQDGFLSSYRRLQPGDQPRRGSATWYAYLETAAPNEWFNHQTYVDTLDRRAIERFIEVTHERYRAVLGREFGKSVPAIFTDEPQFSRKTSLHSPGQRREVTLPWTGGLPASYHAAYGTDLLDTLPELVWQLPGHAPSVARYRYHDHVAEVFASAFADTLGGWCRRHGLLLTGHMMDEESLQSQTHSLGEAMRSYRAFGLPGIDILCDAQEYTTAKQAQSAARQFGCPGVLSELYGVTGWHFDFMGHKRQGDWQAALGVTVRVHHLTGVSLAGEAKRDYPASIGYQAPWFREYRVIEDHFARLNTVLTRGRPVVRIGVIHPIESYWLCFGPTEQTARERDQRETHFQALVRWLIFGSSDFDYIAESLLPGQLRDAPDARLHVGHMAYDVVLVPGLRTIRTTTLDALERLVDSGGQVLFLGEIPTLVDAAPSDRPARLAARCPCLPFEKVAVLEALAPWRELEIRAGPAHDWRHHAAERETILHQLRQDGRARHLFLCNTDGQRGRPDTQVRLRGEWKVTEFDTRTGRTASVSADYRDGTTCLGWDAPAAGSLLLKLVPGRRAAGRSLLQPPLAEAGRLEAPDDGIPVSLSEPNVLLLDQPEWRVDGGAWRERDEILRVDNAARRALGLPHHHPGAAQPWVDRRPCPVVGTLELRFHVTSETPVAEPVLALEDAADIRIALDGQPVTAPADGWWIDESIRQVPLPPISPGTHELILAIPITRRRTVEACYLLGDFGVRVTGRTARIIAPMRTLHWGDWSTQGLPFYAGNVTYHLAHPARPKPLVLEVTRFSAPVIAVQVDGRRVGTLATAPFQLALPARGRRLDLTVYGNRANTLGFLHNCDQHLRWFGPEAWRASGSAWSYEYQLQPMGILGAPRLLEPPSPPTRRPRLTR